MDIKKRLLRRPFTTAIWLLVIGAMALLVGVGGSLMYASGSLSGIMDEYHTSIAVRTDMARWETQSSWGPAVESEDKSFYQKDVDYFMNLPHVEEIYFHTVSAAYSPGFAPVTATAVYSEHNDSYNQMMLAVKVKEILSPKNLDSEDFQLEPNSWFLCVLEVEDVLSQCTNFTRRTEDSENELVFVRFLSGHEPIEEVKYIQEGGRYMLCGIYDPIATNSSYNGVKTPKLPKIQEKYGNVLQNGGLEHPEDNPEFGGTPFMKRLEGSVEDFLADPDNANWAQYLENLNKQNHSLPVIGTEALHTLHAFVNYDANMTQGRFFTQEEYDTGAKVCVLEETLAESSGIKLGDTITLSQYLCHDPDTLGNINRSIRYWDHDGRFNNPTVGLPATRSYAPEETFTVVGLYRLRSQWADTSYSFTPNTVFIPQKAQIEGAFGGMTPGDGGNTYLDEDGNTVTYLNELAAGTYGIYFSMKLKNGMVEDFETMLQDTPWAGQFLTATQGGDAVHKTLSSITGATRTLFLAVALGWLLMAALYVLLYQGRQKRNMGIMLSLGAGKKQTRNYLWGSGMVVCGLGIAVGTVITALTMNLVQNKLLDSTFGVEANRYSVAGLSEDAVSTMITQSQLPLWVIVAAAAAQLLILGLVLYLQAWSMSRKSPRKLMEK